MASVKRGLNVSYPSIFFILEYRNYEKKHFKIAYPLRRVRHFQTSSHGMFELMAKSTLSIVEINMNFGESKKKA